MLLKVVSHYDLSVLSMSVIGFQKNWLGVGCAVSSFLPLRKAPKLYKRRFLVTDITVHTCLSKMLKSKM